MSAKRESKTASLRYEIGESMPEGATKQARAFEASVAAQTVSAYGQEGHVVTQQQHSTVSGTTATFTPHIGLKFPIGASVKLLAMLVVALGSVFFLWEAIEEKSSVGIGVMIFAVLASAIGLVFIFHDWRTALRE